MENNIPKLIQKLKWHNWLYSKVQYAFHGLDDLKANVDLFENAKEILFYAGELYFDFYDNDEFLQSLQKALHRGARIKAVFGPAIYVESKDFLKVVCNNPNVQLYKRSYRDPAHFKIIQFADGNQCAIVDKPHDIDIDKDDRGSVFVMKGYDSDIVYLRNKFEDQTKNSVRVNMDNIVKEFSDRGKRENGEFYGFISKAKGKIDIASDDQIQDLARHLSVCTEQAA